MNNVAMLSTDGRVSFVIHPSHDEQYVDGDLYGEHIAKIIPFEENVVELLGKRWDFELSEFVEIPEQPGSFYVWDAEGKNWVLDENAKLDYLRKKINPLRDELESSPVFVDGNPFQIDEKAEKRMQDAIELWDYLGQTTIPWIMANDQELQVDKNDLIYIYNNAKIARGLRAMQLHTEARALRLNINTTDEDIENWKNSHLIVF